MANRFIYSLLLLACAASALTGCTADPELDPQPSLGGDGSDSWVTIDFCDDSFDEVNITTRATLDNVAESRVSNLFVFIFGPKEKDENGNEDAQRVYGRFFDYKTRKDSQLEVNDSKDECWWVEGNATDEEPHGKVRILAPAIAGGTLYLLANVNADMVNISPDKLRFVQTLSELKRMTATLNQEIAERNGYFPMTGLAGNAEGNIAIGSGKITCNGSTDFEVPLTRLDAKIVVKVRVAKGYRGSKTSTTTATGGESGSGGTGSTTTTTVTTTHEIDSFVPLSWQVVNLPRTAFVLPQDADAETKTFSTRDSKFETREPDKVSYTYEENVNGVTQYVTKEDVPTEAHGFSFYMLENRNAPKKTIDPNAEILNEGKGYHARETRLKDENGAYIQGAGGEDDIWKYAPEEATYLVIKGEVIMALDISNEGKDQQLSADVEYYIHLGDFDGESKDVNGDGKIDAYEKGGIDNYSVLRNTSYTYTITIYGVDNIQVEVEKKVEENESGATGHVYVAKESIFTFDSHYGCTVVSFDEAHITDIDNLTWYVKTPFGREGTPHIVSGIEVPAGLDYQWVHFMINRHDDQGYSKMHENYNPEKVMNILEFSKYIKDQKIKFQKDKEDGHIDNDSEFRPEYDVDWATKFPDQTALHNRYRIYITIFVDEFYYTANPLTGDVRTDLWKDFVNKPNRMMHILCDADMSADEASRTTGSVVTIRQRSIQTVFNFEKPELQTAWGCETIDETRNGLWYFSRKESYNSNGDWVAPSSGVPDAAGNNSADNGLYNTVRIWGLIEGGKYTPKLWSDYVDYERTNALYDADDKETLRYSCLTRNRDENGNGIIDANEIKWYMASINQLGSLYIGDQGLHADAILYPYYKQEITSPEMDETNTYPWRVHIVSSSAYGGGSYPEILWAEEGMSTGSYHQTWHKSACLSVRCVRNLGMDVSSEEEARTRLEEPDAGKYMPEKVIQVSGPGVSGNTETVTANSVYKFDLTNLNPQSIRYYTSQELEPNNEFSVEARTYWAFETGILTDEKYTYPALRDLIKDGRSPCPDGYRIPNVREAALMSLFCPNWGWQVELDEKGELVHSPGRVSTWYSHGLLGTDQDKGTTDIDKYPNNESVRSNSWYFTGDRTYLDTKDNSGRVRCVKDIRQ